MRYKVTELAAYVGISRQRVNDHCRSGKLSRVNGKIDSEDPINKDWILKMKSGPPTHKPIGQSPHREYIPSEGAEEPSKIDGIALLELSDEELSKHSKATIDKLKSLEAMLKSRQERETKRGNLIERQLVASVFGELYTIDSNSWKTLGSKVAADVAGLCDCDDPDKVLQVEQRIDGEVIKILAHVKQFLNAALESWEPK